MDTHNLDSCTSVYLEASNMLGFQMITQLETMTSREDSEKFIVKGPAGDFGEDKFKKAFERVGTVPQDDIMLQMTCQIVRGTESRPSSPLRRGKSAWEHL